MASGKVKDIHPWTFGAAEMNKIIAKLSLKQCFTAAFFVDTHSRCLIKKRFKSELESYQASDLTFVRTDQHWHAVEEKFTMAINNYAFLSMDVEHQTSTNIVTYILFASLDGRVVVFDVRALLPEASGDVLGVLPPAFGGWLRDPDVIIGGSGIAIHLRDIGFKDATNLLETADLFKAFYSRRHAAEPLLDIGNTKKTGLGVQAHISKRLDFKPMRPSVFTNLYGEHAYTNAAGNRTWPDWRNPCRLFLWKRNDDGLPDSATQFYLFHEATAPVSIICRIVLDLSLKDRITYSPEETPRSLVHRILSDFVSDSALLSHFPSWPVTPGGSKARTQAH